MYRHLYQLEYLIATELVWIVSIPVVSLAVVNSYLQSHTYKIVSSF